MKTLPERKYFYAALLVLIFIINLFPIYSLLKFGPYLFYENAFDEASYLQYDFSLASQSPTRAGQYLVTLAHNLHLSSGWINFLFDIFTPMIFIIMAQRIFLLFKFSEKESCINAILLFTLPLLFSGANPLIKEAQEATLKNGFVRWITIPEARFPPDLRTPEPQLSYILLSAALYFSLRRRVFWPVYLVVPFLYPFVGAPVLVIVLALHIRSKLPAASKNDSISILVSYAVVSLIFLVQLNFIFNDEQRVFFTNTRAPLISFTSCVAVFLYVLFRRTFDQPMRFPLLVIALAPLCVVNQHIISGWLRQPIAFEQFFGTMCCALVLLFIRGKNLFAHIFLCAAACGMLYISTSKIFRSNYVLTTKVTLDKETLEILRTHSADAAVNDYDLASRLSMLFPKQPATLLGFQNTNPPHSKEHLSRYLCARKEILENPNLAPLFSDVLSSVTHSYHYENSDYVLLNSGRKKEFQAVHDVSQEPKNCEARKLFPILVK